MTSSDYLSLLRDPGPEIFGQDLLFQQDNCPVHKAQITRNFFEESGVNVLQWPVYSPDLNIIKNLSAIVKRRLQKARITWEILDETVTRVWESIDEKNCYKTVQFPEKSRK